MVCQKNVGMNVNNLILLKKIKYINFLYFISIEHNLTLIASIGSVSFIKYLINSVIFQNGLLALGRPEMFLIMPPPVYIVSKH